MANGAPSSPFATRTVAALVAVALAAAGCRVERTLSITSDPSGARVLLEDQRVGETPVRVPFDYYGIQRVCLSKEGRQTCSELIDLKAPWYFRFPLDIVSEVFLPFGWSDRRHLALDLPAGQEVVGLPEIRSVLERANLLRHAGPEGPPPLPPVRPRLLPRLERDPLQEASAPALEPSDAP